MCLALLSLCMEKKGLMNCTFNTWNAIKHVMIVKLQQAACTCVGMKKMVAFFWP